MTDPVTRNPAEVDTTSTSQRYRIALDCVHCGLCLPTCPSYHVTGLEAASPRGRILLMRAFEEGTQNDTPALREHMESCLVCRACETACPSGVRFGMMMEEFRAVLRGQLQSRPARHAGKVGSRLGALLLNRVVPARRTLRGLANLLWATQRLGLVALARHTGLLRLLRLEEREGLAPRVPSPAARRDWPARLAPYGPQRARVLFLRGCITPELVPSMQTASLEVLRHNGCEVITPAEQTCCGAMHFHAGQRRRGLQLLQRNVQVMEAACIREQVDAVVVNTAGCGSTLKEYGELVGEDVAAPQRDAARRVASRVRDISEFLDALGLVPPPVPVPRRVTYDAPCHLLHGQGIAEAPLRLLRRIPQLEIVPLRDADRCCGSAGLYSLLQPDIAGELGREKAERIREADVDAVVTGNSGCILQIQSALRRFAPASARAVEVLHPIELLQRAYGASRRDEA